MERGGDAAAGSEGSAGSRVRRVAVWMLYASALAPLVFSSRTIFPYVVPRAVFFRALTAGAAAVALYLIATRRGSLPGWRRDPFLVALALFVAVLFATALAGEAPIRSLFGDLERMGGVIAWVHFLAFYVAVRTLLTERDLVVFLWVTLAAASAVSGVAVLQEAGVTVGILPGTGATRAISTIGNPGYLAVYALFGVALAGFLGARSGGVAGRAGAALGLAVNGGALLLTWTRAALAGLGAGLLVGLVVYLLVAESRRRRAWTLAGVAGLLLLGAVAGSELWSRATDEFRVAARLGDVSLLERSLGFRYAAWQAGARAAADHPVTGLGAENFRLAFDWHFDPQRFAGQTHYTRAHNDFVEFLVAGGIPGALAWVALWAALFWSLVAARREGRLGPGETALLGGTFAAYLVYLLFWFHDQNSLPVFLALAAFVALRRDGPLLAEGADPGRGGSRHRHVAVGIALALLVAGDVVYHGRLLATGHHLLEAAEEPQLQARVDHYRQAMDLRPPGAEETVTELARFAVQLPAAIRAAGGEPGSSPGVDTVLARARAFLAAQIGRDPRNPRLHRDAGRLHVITYQWSNDPAQLDSATIRFREAIALAPGRLSYRHMLSEAHLIADRPTEAVGVLEEGLGQYGENGETLYFLAKALLVRGRHLEAADVLTRAYELGYRDRNPTVRQVLIRELRGRGEGEVVARLREARRAPRQRSR